jgi:hypothetical protein
MEERCLAQCGYQQANRSYSPGLALRERDWTVNPPSHGSPCKIEIQGRESMASFKQPDFIARQEAAAKARKVALEKFRAKAADPALAERLTARAARAAERSAIKTTREIERAEKEVREAERAQQAERDAAIEAEREKAESGERERALQAKQKAARDARYAARKSRPKRR